MQPTKTKSFFFFTPPIIHRLITHALASLVLLLSVFTILHYTTSLQPFSLLRFAFVLPHVSSVCHEPCDFSNGRWVHDEAPQYYSEECPFLDPGFLCRRNGRRDVGYLQWRWRPHCCTLPRFNASDMLERSRDKRILFVGDSIGRNQWESLVCMLWDASVNRTNVFEKNGSPISKHKGFLSIFYEEYNLTVEYYRAPFLVAIGRPPPNSPSWVRKAIRLDTPHWNAGKWVGGDVVVFNAGHWWNRDKTLNQGNYFQIGERLNLTMDVKEAFRKTMETLTQWAEQNLRPQKGFVFFRSFSQSHYSNGTWDTGGGCGNETAPKEDGQKVRPEPWSNRVTREVLREKEKVGFLNITYLTELRGDGHPSSHRERGTSPDAPQDCSHWCLPGVPDTWNEVLYAHLISNGYGMSSTHGS